MQIFSCAPGNPDTYYQPVKAGQATHLNKV